MCSVFSSLIRFPLYLKINEIEVLAALTDKEVVLQFGIYQDKALQLYVNMIGQKLVSKLTNKEFRKVSF